MLSVSGSVHQLIVQALERASCSTEQLEGMQFKAEELLRLTKVIAPEKGDLEK